MTANGSLLDFWVEDECNETQERRMRVPHKVRCFQTSKEMFSKLYFDESGVYDETDFERRF